MPGAQRASGVDGTAKSGEAPGKIFKERAKKREKFIDTGKLTRYLQKYAIRHVGISGGREYGALVSHLHIPG
jgi:hypothetical protein